MAAPQVFPIAQVPLTTHAFSPDRSQVAVSLNNNDAQIYTRHGQEWTLTETLSEHDKLITSIDWAPQSNRIVTASQDRNAYVWSQSPDPSTGQLVWKPTLVLLRINRAATYVRWSPREDKFAVASGARAICICSFDEENNWWVARLIKKPIRSTVLSVDWHPNNVLLAAGSADMKARVFSAYIKDVDKRPLPSVWGEKLPFNTLCGEFASPSGGWVHSVAFSPSGDLLAFASHDSSITVVYPDASGAHGLINIKGSTLPYLTLIWTAEDAIVAAGHDCQPVLFKGGPEGWAMTASLDDATSTPRSAGGSPKPGVPPRNAGGVGRLNSAAFNTFRNADTRGGINPGGPTLASPGGVGVESEIMTVHQNTITAVRPYEHGANGEVTKVSTTGLDGKLVIWSVNAGAAGLAARLGGVHLR
ncbi:actin-related protein ARPC3 [Sistotremastrum niveocremeum HHB9708]|uniref:Arp2/3 complex 41 kDa subunit n=2 Tax=Sistotremastraceae TaxID=3402574 RepID=A0A164QVN7_9AGAM|nr:actin-related protein ARPC3 [Sistotremastrum niveocremeum HHB9708]KZT39239.1 WD40 repeat-like protein [Sistotremastrum suecicum HHB10207 ss-3]